VLAGRRVVTTGCSALCRTQVLKPPCHSCTFACTQPARCFGETRDDAVAALLLFLKPAFVPCMFLAGSNLAALPIFQLRPFILDQGHAHQVLDTMCQPSCDLLPRRTCRRNAWTATASHATVDRQQLGRRLKGAGCRSRQGRRHPRPVSLSPSGTSTSRPSHRSLLFDAHHPFIVMPEHQLRDLGEPPFQAPISPSKCSMICMNLS
jgi:hypothetical protein